ncbi:asparagine synthase [Candidatus Woesearchaeota archaeon]|nr:asparagine synthase [Candidatus Woesearchaeota archaeon]
MLSKTDWEKKIENLRTKEVISDKKEAVETIKKLISEAVEKLIPKKQSFGVLFSGGVDSTLIAYLLQKKGHDFTCYSVGFFDENQKMSEDLEISKKIAKKLGLKQRIIVLDFREVEKVIKETVNILGPKLSNVVNVGVGAVEVAGIITAKKDGVNYLFGGLGSEEIFAGYERHKKAEDVDEESWNGLIGMYERDLLRDDAISTHFDTTLLTPFLDEELIREAMKIPSKYKVNEKGNKLVLRRAAVELGLDEEYAFRPKRAAQYGSRINNALDKLARKNKQLKAEYITSLLEEKK